MALRQPGRLRRTEAHPCVTLIGERGVPADPGARPALRHDPIWLGRAGNDAAGALARAL
jgi:hypothetical protein